MKIANGVEMLEIPANAMGTPSVINPTLIWNNDTVILVDAGYPGQLSLIREAIEKAGVQFDKLNIVLLTHQDIDHIGSLSSILQKLPSAKVLAHEQEQAYIQGERLPIKVDQLEANLNSLSQERRAVYEKLKTAFHECKVNVDQTLSDGEELPYCGGITVIYTPGHTPGHICLYLAQYKLLIAGDALVIENGQLVPSPQFINYDNNLNLQSLKKLCQFDIETVICYHGGLYKDSVSDRIRELATKS